MPFGLVCYHPTIWTNGASGWMYEMEMYEVLTGYG